MDAQDFEGWTNQATFLLALYINNDATIQSNWHTAALEEFALAASDHPPDMTPEFLAVTTLGKRLRNALLATAQDQMGTTDQERLCVDLVTYALGQVQYREIAATLLQAAQER